MPRASCFCIFLVAAAGPFQPFFINGQTLGPEKLSGRADRHKNNVFATLINSWSIVKNYIDKTNHLESFVSLKNDKNEGGLQLIIDYCFLFENRGPPIYIPPPPS